MIKLKPCPFCGKTYHLDCTDEDIYYMLLEEFGNASIRLSCRRCKVEIWELDDSIKNYEDKLNALFEKWNARELTTK